MDGNGRWAKKRGLPRIAGHKRGGDSLKAVLKAAAELGVKYLSVYAFSTENWGRPKAEVDFLMGLFSQTIDRQMEELMENEVRLRFLGRLDKLSAPLQKKMQAAMEKTRENKLINLNVMVNYGGRAEIVDTLQSLIDSGEKTIDEKAISSRLYTKDIPDPDLLIRTASEFRVSNFMLWQIAYAEIYVTATLWPDFRKEQLVEAIENYQKRERRYGKLK
jgi:undecaprenyl diphosphate synthase